MKTIKYIFIFLLLMSCKKKTTITGRVYNPVNGKGISGIEVVLTKEKISLPVSDGKGSKQIAKTTTNSEGYYSFTERLSKNRPTNLAFGFDPKKYKKVEHGEISFGPSDNGKSFDWPLIPIGYLKVKIDNINCFNTNDKLEITKSYEWTPDFYTGQLTYNGCYHYEFTGSIDGSPIGYILAPMGWHVANGTVTKNGITNSFYDSVYIDEGEFQTWHLMY